ncbi:glutamate--tRNA ligase [Candidatus Albibeggiatoa sp. nov. BB20]|uniref:glutamate--tRNA ligase n=1 Tax=Candidatus Albibeggiatoa sp. nov. BB20 TaxID=3162723 RepID=UPI003365A7D2
MTMIKTRFAPSPTGYMHLGNARTALFNALFAFHHQGIFLLRIEDTDQERSEDQYVEQLKNDLRWLGMDWQEGPDIDGEHAPYFQSQRSEIYAKYYHKLIDSGKAYPCFCSPRELELSRKLQRSSGQAPRYAGTCAHLNQEEIERKLAEGLKPTLRFRMPRDEMIEFDDVVKGQQRFASNDIGDFIIRRADGTPAFFFCNAVDDALMGVTHVFRGDDHLTNTPRQQMILESLGLPVPQYGHISLILGDDGTPLSKRNGSLSIQELQQTGWQPNAVVNYLSRLGHAYEEEKGYLPMAELAAGFKLNRLGKAASRFDKQQLLHWQQAAIADTDISILWEQMHDSVKALVPEAAQHDFINTVRPNIQFPHEAAQWAEILFNDDLDYQADTINVITEAGAEFFQHAIQALDETQADYKPLINQLKQAAGVKGKKLFMPLRAALTGETHGPEMANLLGLMGVERAKIRLQKAASF